MTPVDVIQKKEPKDMVGYNKMTGFQQGAADLAPLYLDLSICTFKRNEQEKIRLFKIEKKNQQQKSVAAAKNHINKKNYSMKYHVILGRF